MDYQTRLAKVEATMESNRQDIDRMYEAISELRKRFDEQRNYIDKRFEEQRNYIDRRFEEQRKYTDDALKDLGMRMDEGFRELRREQSISQRWMIGMTLTNTTMILGLGGKLFGLY
jgi:hypothetical protein